MKIIIGSLGCKSSQYVKDFEPYLYLHERFDEAWVDYGYNYDKHYDNHSIICPSRTIRFDGFIISKIWIIKGLIISHYENES